MGKFNGIADKKLFVPVILDSGDQCLIDLDDLGCLAKNIDNVAVAGAIVIDGNLGAATGFAEAFQPVQLLLSG